MRLAGTLFILFACSTSAIAFQEKDVDLLRNTGQCNKCDLSGFRFPDGADLKDTSLLGANLSGAVLHRVSLFGAKLRGANFTGAMMSAANLEKADIDGANFRDADLQKADFFEANLSRANFQGANLEGASLWRSIALKTNFQRAILRGVKFKGTVLGAGTSLQEADLTNATFTDAEIGEIDLRGANLNGVTGLTLKKRF